MLEQTTIEVIAVNDHRKCYRGDHTTVIVIMPFKLGGFCFVKIFKGSKNDKGTGTAQEMTCIFLLYKKII